MQGLNICNEFTASCHRPFPEVALQNEACTRRARVAVDVAESEDAVSVRVVWRCFSLQYYWVLGVVMAVDTGGKPVVTTAGRPGRHLPRRLWPPPSPWCRPPRSLPAALTPTRRSFQTISLLSLRARQQTRKRCFEQRASGSWTRSSRRVRREASFSISDRVVARFIGCAPLLMAAHRTVIA